MAAAATGARGGAGQECLSPLVEHDSIAFN